MQVFNFNINKFNGLLLYLFINVMYMRLLYSFTLVFKIINKKLENN